MSASPGWRCEPAPRPRSSTTTSRPGRSSWRRRSSTRSSRPATSASPPSRRTETAAGRLARAIGESLPLPGPQEREWVLWVELWLRAVREPELRAGRGTALRALPPLARGDHPKRALKAASSAPTSTQASAADRAMALLDGAGVRVLFGDPAMDFDRALRARRGEPRAGSRNRAGGAPCRLGDCADLAAGVS